MRLIVYIASIVRLILTLGVRGSVKYMLAQRGTGVFNVPVKYLRRSVAIRAGTSDRWVLNTVIVCQEYRGLIDFSPRTIIDAGANIGCATLYWKHCFPDAQVIALEPDDDNYELALKNTEGLDGVTVLKSGLWSRRTQLRISNPSAWKYALQVEESCDGPISAESVSSLMATQGWQHVDLVKLDIEGAEVAVLSENVDQWIDRVNVLIVELHQDIAPTGARLLCAALSKLDFRLSWRGEDLVATRVHRL